MQSGYNVSAGAALIAPYLTCRNVAEKMLIAQIWVPEIPSNLTNYTVPIDLPSGTSFLLTMWGASGIAHAGTTDVMSASGRPFPYPRFLLAALICLAVAPSNKSTCFLTDAQILALYTFSFNISDTFQGYPPQCSNLSLSWPTSLETNVTGGMVARRAPSFSAGLNNRVLTLSPPRGSKSGLKSRSPGIINGSAPGDSDFAQLDQSSSGHTWGNTTSPPTMFGIIPLGNSFSIPISYARSSKIAQVLPTRLHSPNTPWCPAQQ